MLLEESKTINNMIRDIKNMLILNICSSDEYFYKTTQPHIWENIHKPLLENNNQLLNLDIKKKKGVDVVNNCKDMTDIKSNTIDIVLFFSGIEHVFNPQKVIKEIYRVLKNDGILIASAPGVYPYHEDPIDNNIRLKTMDEWNNLLGYKWKIIKFEKSNPQKLNSRYKSDKSVYATIITAKKKENDIKVDAILLSYKREKNLKYVIRGLKRQSFINEIYVFHNFPSRKKISGVINICSEKNFGCIIRHSLGLRLDSEYVLFIDDDIELKTDFSRRFTDAIKFEPDSVIGLFGRMLNTKDNKPYTNGLDVLYSSFMRYVDIVKGRIHLIKRINLINSLEFISKNLIEESMIEDDIILNITNQIKHKLPSLIIPSDEKEIKNLNEEHALAFRKGHLNLRDNYINEFLFFGWKPKTHSGKFLRKNIEFGGELIKDEQRTFKIRNAIKEKNFPVIKREFEKLENKSLFNNREIYNIAGLYRINNNFRKALILYKIVINNDLSEKKEISGLSYFHIGAINLDINLEIAEQSLRNCLRLIPDHQKANELLYKIKNNAYIDKK